MFDINFVLPTSARKDIYYQRLIDFKKFGIINIKDKKVLITLLKGTETIDTLQENWPENVIVEVISSQYDEVVQKTYDYFSSLEKPKARWTAKIDDDSCNDVSNLVDNLDKNYSDKEVYVCCFLNRVDYQLLVEKNALIKLGYGHWLTPEISLWHEWEASFISNACLDKIINNKDSMSLLKIRSQSPGGVTDACLAFAARIAGLIPVDCHFATHQPLVGHFSVIGGCYNHIHFVSRISGGLHTSEKNGHFAFDFLRIILEEDYDKDLYDQFLNQDYVFLGKDNTPLGMLSFKENGLVAGKKHDNESLWILKDNKFIFLNNRGVPTGEFLIEDGKIYSGKSLVTNAEIFLRKLL